jgi:Fic family protein
VQEAVLSSRIEGTQATFGEVLEFEAGEETANEEKKADIQEVLNYRAAMRHAVTQMETLPLSQRLMKGAHQVLMQGVRGQDKAPGDYRRIPNWIGPLGGTVETARFVPISAERVPDAMSAWERYLHADAPDKLIQLAILHAEFEAIHPVPGRQRAPGPATRSALPRGQEAAVQPQLLCQRLPRSPP